MKNPGFFPTITLFMMLTSSLAAQKIRSTEFPMEMLADHPEIDIVLANKDLYEVQIIYTQIDRDKKNKPSFTDHFFNLNADRYYYPASTVKFPIAILALQKLRELNIAGLDMNSTMITAPVSELLTGVATDSSAPNGKPSIAHYIRKILLVSDNDAFNRLYEFLGQDYINENLHRMGYTNTSIIHRLEISLPLEQNRITNPVSFYDANGKLLYEKPLQNANYRHVVVDPSSPNYRRGKGFMRGNTLVNEPFDFSVKNKFPLADFHQIVRSIMFPEGVPKKQRFDLTEEDYSFLRKYMSMRPPESNSPKYDSSYGDNYVKMVYYGSEKTAAEPNIRIFNKTGTAYGFLIESCYFADYEKNIEFMVSAIIYCNSDGIFNDNHYDYDVLGYPFFKNLGKILYDREKKRNRRNKPDLSSFRFSYVN